LNRIQTFATRHRSALILLACVLVFVAAVVGVMLVRNNDTSRADVADDRVALADVQQPDAAAVARGRYVAVSSDCVACHTNHHAGGAAYAGGFELQSPFGVIVGSNITPDRTTGIGEWTERDFFKAMRHGQGKNEYLYPAMPYNAYAKLSDRDVHDLWSYMATVTPVQNPVDANRLPFPFNIRLLMAGWNLLFFDNSGFEARGGEAPEIARGRYLVDGAGHCASCHTAKNMLGGDKSAYLQGGLLQGWFAPEITNDAQRGLGRWSEADVAGYLRHGFNAKGVASGPMAEAVEYSTQHLTDTDLRAIAKYLKGLPGSKSQVPSALAATDPIMVRGKHVYDANCTACHGQNADGLLGLAPAFNDNPAVRAQDSSSMLHVLMTGGRAAASQSNPTAAGMPSFAWKLSDADMAAVLTYLRNSHGNAAELVTARQAKDARTSTGAREPLQAKR
jgi:mono/diheme cytochrome c family protein